jgi:2-hydroxychromene-2-carboxylate isomerase
MTATDVEFFFDPVCPFCWVTSQWVRNVARQRPLEIVWRPLSLHILNEPIGYDGKPAAYPEAHQRGLEMLRVVVAARHEHGQGVVGPLYEAMGEAIWNSEPPAEASFEAVLVDTARPRDLRAIVQRAGLPGGLAAASVEARWDDEVRAETQHAVDRVGGGVGTPILSFDPPDGLAFFGPVIDHAPDGRDALAMWEAVITLVHRPGFAELKRSLRSFPATPLSARVAGQDTDAR